jgi:hypothetical protein
MRKCPSGIADTPVLLWFSEVFLPIFKLNGWNEDLLHGSSAGNLPSKTL